MGEKALDRSEEITHRYPPTSAAALKETSDRTGRDIIGVFLQSPVLVSPLKYRSERRKDQLQAVMRLLIAAALMFADHPNDSVQRWNALLLPWFHVAVWDFPTVISKTPMQQARPP